MNFIENDAGFQVEYVKLKCESKILHLRRFITSSFKHCSMSAGIKAMLIVVQHGFIMEQV